MLMEMTGSSHPHLQQARRTIAWLDKQIRRYVILRYAFAVVLVVLMHIFIVSTRRFIEPAISCLFLATVMIDALYVGLGPALLATALATLDTAYTFIEPE